MKLGFLIQLFFLIAILVRASNGVALELSSDIDHLLEVSSESQYIDVSASNNSEPEKTISEQFQFRFLFEWTPTSNSSLDMHYQGLLLASIYQSPSMSSLSSASAANRGQYRLDDLNVSPIGQLNNSDLTYQQNLDRFVWHQQFKNLDVHLGRQAITFGSARFINGSDVLYPVALGGFTSDYRTGVDALRVEVPLNDLSVLDMGYVAGSNRENSAQFGRVKNNILQTDVTFTYIKMDREKIISIGLEGGVGDFGLWQEWNVLTSPELAKEKNRLSLGVDQSINDYLIQLEYHYNELGSLSTDDYLSNVSESIFYQKGAVQLLAQRYVITSLTYLAGARISFDASIMLNTNDQSQLLQSNYGLNLNEDWDLTLQASLPIDCNKNSEFSTYPKRLSLRLKAVF